MVATTNNKPSLHTVLCLTATQSHWNSSRPWLPRITVQVTEETRDKRQETERQKAIVCRPMGNAASNVWLHRQCNDRNVASSSFFLLLHHTAVCCLSIYIRQTISGKTGNLWRTHGPILSLLLLVMQMTSDKR